MNKKREISDLVYNNFNLTRLMLLMKNLNSFLLTQNISTFQKFFSNINELRKVKSRTVGTQKKKTDSGQCSF